MSATSLTQENASSSLLAGNDGFATSFQHISSITVGSLGASSVSFTEIPQNFRHLQIRTIGRSNFASPGIEEFKIIVNSDTGSNYAYHTLQGSGTAVASAGASSASAIRVMPSSLISANALANAFGTMIVDILDYSNTSKYKTLRTLSGSDINGSGYVGLCSGLWMNTAPVSSITFSNWAGAYSFVQYSTFSLYGIR